MNNPKPQQPQFSMFDKIKIAQNLAFFPALSLLVFTRSRLGFRNLKPAWLIGIALVLKFINGLCAMNFLIFRPAGPAFAEFPYLVVGFGLYQRYKRWRELCAGERWHSRSPGVSFLERLPLPAWFQTQRRIVRYLEPAACFAGAVICGLFVSEALARWIAFSSFCLFVHEQAVYEHQLESDLDVLDGLIAAEVQGETAEHFSGPQLDEKARTLEQTAGIPTGVDFSLQKQIELLRAKQSLEQRATSPKPSAPDNLAAAAV